MYAYNGADVYAYTCTHIIEYVRTPLKIGDQKHTFVAHIYAHACTCVCDTFVTLEG